MSQTNSPSLHSPYGLKRVCRVWGVARSTYYSRQKTSLTSWDKERRKPGPRPETTDDQLLDLITQDIVASPFQGEGHRKVHACLKRQNTRVGRNRVLRVMKANHLLSPHRNVESPPHPHDGTIITNQPNIMWCSDGTKTFTVDDGWVWIFSVEEHWNAECLGCPISKVGDRFAALEAVIQAVKNVYGTTAQGVTKGLKLRINNGSQYTSEYFLKQIAYMGIQDSFGLRQFNFQVHRLGHTRSARKVVSPGVQAVLNAFKDHREGLLKALDHPGLPLHNNDSERDIRGMVKFRKVSGDTQ